MYSFEKEDIFVSRDVYFYEEVFPFRNNEKLGVEELLSEGEYVVVEDEVKSFRNKGSGVEIDGTQHMDTNEGNIYMGDTKISSHE